MIVTDDKLVKIIHLLERLSFVANDYACVKENKQDHEFMVFNVEYVKDLDKKAAELSKEFEKELAMKGKL